MSAQKKKKKKMSAHYYQNALRLEGGNLRVLSVNA